MQQSAKHFSEKLNKCLDELGMPSNMRDRALMLSKMLHVPKQQLWALLEGHIMPDESLLHRLTVELEVDANYFN